MTKLSIALCSYNGARYLREQLDSITAQTRPPDEVVICDDASSDGTAALLQDFARHAPFPVHLHVNPRNVGSTENFGRAIALCGGGIIALSDQDDLWHPEKLMRLEAMLASEPEIQLVFTDAELVDHRGERLGERLWPSVGFDARQQERVLAGDAFHVLLRKMVVTGATMAFRADLRRLALPIPADTAYIHDAWLAVVAATVGRVACIPEPLIRYRQHPEQQIGAGNDPGGHFGFTQHYYRKHLRAIETLITRVEQSEFAVQPPVVQRLTDLHRLSRHLRTRIAMPETRMRRLPAILGELLSGRYTRYSSGLRSAGRDLLR